MTYHNNSNIGLTAWNSSEQSYYLIPFANVNNFFRELGQEISVSEDLVDAAHNFMSTYNPEQETVLLTLNEDLLTVAVINKNQKTTDEAMAQQLGWSLPKFKSFYYLWSQLSEKNAPACLNSDLLCSLFKLSNLEYDNALAVLLY